MVQLTLIEKDKLEHLFNMGGGYVLDFSDARFADFFRDFGINIDDPKYTETKPSQSKANRLRGFWAQEKSITVGKVLEKLIDYAHHLKEKDGTHTENDRKLIADCRNISNRLIGNLAQADPQASKSDFLAIDFGDIAFSKLPVEPQVLHVLEGRLSEAQICLKNGANLSSIFMAGSILEGTLLGVAQKYPRQFNESNCCPKDKSGKPKQFQEWTLSELINVGRDIDILDEDVKKFSHVLRDFRNYIHPYQQMASQFNPDKDTAEICLQVLKAALSDLIKNKLNE